MPVVVVAAAAGLRLWGLGTVPPGFQFDEAYNALDAHAILNGHPGIFFTANGGREPMLAYLQAAALAALGHDHTVLAIRLVSSLVGILTVALLYRLVADMFADRTLALAAAGFLAVSFWHVHFSHYAIRSILVALWTTAAIWAWWRATRLSPTPAWAILCGVFLAAGVYSHPAGRVVPFILIADALLMWLHARDRSKEFGATGRAWRALLIAGITSAVLFVPLARFFLHNPSQFVSHPSDVSVAEVAAGKFGGNLIGTALFQILGTAGMFAFRGDTSWYHNLPGLPVFDPVSALLTLIGATAGILEEARHAGSGRNRALLIGAWLLLMLLPAVLSDHAADFSRAMGALPATIVLTALGLGWLLRRLRPRGTLVVAFVTLCIFLVGGSWTAYHYFGQFAHSSQLYYAYDEDKVDGFQALRALSNQGQVFVAPLWSTQSTISYLNLVSDGRLRSLDGRDSLIFPPGRPDIVIAFPAHDARRQGWDQQAASLYGAASTRIDVSDAYQNPLVITFYIPGSMLGDLRPPTDAPLEPHTWVNQTFDASFGPAIRFIGYTIGDPQAGEPLSVNLMWECLQPISRNLTVFVHLLGPDNRKEGQADREPARNSYRTSVWQPGDLLIDRYQPVLAGDAKGSFRIAVGWYDRETGGQLTIGTETQYLSEPIEIQP